MKTLLIFIVLVGIFPFCYGQSMYQGVWNTNNPNKTTVISNYTSTKDRLFRLSYAVTMDDDSIEEYEVIVDGRKIIPRFFEGGGSIVEGKILEIRRTGNDQVTSGIWNIVSEEGVTPIKSIWSAHPIVNKDVLVADFLIAREFVLWIGQPLAKTCENVFMEVYIDGQVVKDSDGRVVRFPGGSSFIGYGKKVTVKTFGTCSKGNIITGEITIAK